MDGEEEEDIRTAQDRSGLIWNYLSTAVEQMIGARDQDLGLGKKVKEGIVIPPQAPEQAQVANRSVPL